jgi:hypothetical protein
MFKKYVLPAVDQKIIDVVGKYFQIIPRERLYLDPGTIAKTSSGKIRHQFNRQRFLKHNFEGLIDRVFSSQDDEGLVYEDKNKLLELEIMTLFEKIVSLTPELDKPILDCGADSVAIFEFVDKIEKKYQHDFEVDEKTSLRDILRRIK